MMNKKKESIFSYLVNSVTAHPWIKLVSLILAIVVWFYVSGEKP